MYILIVHFKQIGLRAYPFAQIKKALESYQRLLTDRNVVAAALQDPLCNILLSTTSDPFTTPTTPTTITEK